MPPIAKTLPLLLALALFPAHSFADERLDQILEELAALRQQVSDLEDRLAAIEEQGQVPVVQSAPPAEDKADRKSWFDSMRVELKKAEVRASGPWTRPESWESLKKGMEEEAVIELLGEPTDRKFSVRLDTDEIFHYRGDLEGAGEPLEGEVRIYKGKVRRFVVPDFTETAQ